MENKIFIHIQIQGAAAGMAHYSACGIVAHKLNNNNWSICKRVLLDVLGFV
jgi:hypothetical protein